MLLFTNPVSFFLKPYLARGLPFGTDSGLPESTCQGHPSKEGEGTGTARRNWQVPTADSRHGMGSGWSWKMMRLYMTCFCL